MNLVTQEQILRLTLGKVSIQLFPSQLWLTNVRERKLWIQTSCRFGEGFVRLEYFRSWHATPVAASWAKQVTGPVREGERERERERERSLQTFVIYWPSTEPSIKRCTCVNKRRKSGSRWTWDNYIIRCHRRLGSVPVGVGVSWGQDTELRASGRRIALGPQWPTVEQPQPRWGRSAAMVRRTLGQYVAVCPRLQLTSHTQQTSTLSRIKCERLYFYKEVCLFVRWSSSLLLIMFPLIFLYVYV